MNSDIINIALTKITFETEQKHNRNGIETEYRQNRNNKMTEQIHNKYIITKLEKQSRQHRNIIETE